MYKYVLHARHGKYEEPEVNLKKILGDSFEEIFENFERFLVLLASKPGTNTHSTCWQSKTIATHTHSVLGHFYYLNYTTTTLYKELMTEWVRRCGR